MGRIERSRRQRDQRAEESHLHRRCDAGEEAADERAKDADTDAKYIENGVVRPDQVKKRLSNDPNSGYAGIEDEPIEDLPDDDIGAITDRIMEIGSEPPAAETTPDANAALPTDMGLPEGAQGGLVQQQEEATAEGTMGAHQSQMTQDPSSTDDPGLLKQ